VFVYKAHPPVHIRICAGGCNTVDGRKDKQGGGFISFLRPYNLQNDYALACALNVFDGQIQQNRDALNDCLKIIFPAYSGNCFCRVPNGRSWNRLHHRPKCQRYQ
jgi:hypothetical protein